MKASLKFILNWCYFIGTALQHLAKSGMGVAPAWDKLQEANKRDKYMDELEEHAKQNVKQLIETEAKHEKK